MTICIAVEDEKHASRSCENLGQQLLNRVVVMSGFEAFTDSIISIPFDKNSTDYLS